MCQSRCADGQHTHSGVVEAHVQQIEVSCWWACLKGSDSHPNSAPGSSSQHIAHRWSQNSMANVTSCSPGKNYVPDTFFIFHVSTTFTLPQKQSWRNVHLMPETKLIATSALHGTWLPLKQWMISYKPKMRQLDGVMLGHAAINLLAGQLNHNPASPPAWFFCMEQVGHYGRGRQVGDQTT